MNQEMNVYRCMCANKNASENVFVCESALVMKMSFYWNVLWNINLVGGVTQ